uniref:prepilin-type N-terminal cleavage/methylation domain-containing protein n=1 Tax=Gemmiger formicilis TaxID=745368 RepID=UPI0040254272
MVQYNKNIKNKKKGFTLVELMVVLAITAILAALVGGGLIAYTRLARFEKNEANARTLFQTAQISLTRMETAGELDAFRRQVMEEGSTGDHFQNDVTVTDAGGNTLVSRTKTELDQNVAALYYDRTGAAAGNHNALVERLLGDYIYDASLLNASICVEIDVQSGQVYSVFYDTKSDKLRFNQDGATNIYDRSYDHRRNDSLVGYYSAEDRVNVVQLVQTKLKVKNPRLTNGETLTLSWSGNSSLGDLDTSYTATAYDAAKEKQLFTITIQRDVNGTAGDDKQVITKMPVTIYHYSNTGEKTSETKELYFPLSYNKGSFVLTLDAMADAALLRACENSADVAATSLYSITRLLNDPQDIYIAMRAEPRENYSDAYTASSEVWTPTDENTLLAKGGTAVTADLKYFRHLYNLRWSADWDITDKGTYTLTPQASNSTGLNWTGGGVTVYCAAGDQYPAAKVPSLNDPVAWPTIPELGENIVLTSKKTGLTTQTTRVPILNLQLSSKSIAKTGKAEKDVLADHYVGLIGENKGKISYITLRDPDIQVNVKTETVAAGALPEANQLRLTATKFITALEDTDDENWRDVRAVGALCGVNTGTLENCALTRGTNSSTSALVAAALAFGDSTTATERTAEHKTVNNKNYTYYTDEPRGIGGLVGVAIPKADSVMQDLTVASDVTVAGLLVDENTKNVTDTTADQQAEKARYAAAAAEPNDENSLWRSVGVGGVFGTVDAAQMKTDSKTNIVNNGFVTGNGLTGGIVGNLFTTGANTSTPSLTGLRNNGTVSAGANYKGDTAGNARSLVLGQFFGGIAGYGRGVILQGCESVTRSDLTETQLKEQVEAGFDKKTGTLTDASPLKGDFVGGLVGYGKDITLDNCKTGKGYVLGSRFVGGLAGGFTGSGVQQNDTNSSDVFGNRYVGGIVSVNGSNSQISGMTNTGLVAAFGKNAAYVGGIVGVNDADWGGSEDKTATATVQNCANRMSGDNATDTRRINLLKELSRSAGSSVGDYADYVGGIAGCNGKNSVVTWDTSTPTLGAILYGNNYVGGVAGYNDEKAIISNTSGQNLTISGQIVAAGKAVGGMIGLNCAPELPSATVKVSRVAGQQLVGGVIGANLPVGGFNVTGGAFNTDVASGRVEADAVAGGIIGYNRLLAPKPANVTLEALLPTID